MKASVQRHLISEEAPVTEGLRQLDALAADAVLFLIDEEGRLSGSITDGDVRRGFINGLQLSDQLRKFANAGTKVFRPSQFSIDMLRRFRSLDYRIIPVVNDRNEIIDVVNFRRQRSYLPLDAVIMAGGKGMRLRPLTEDTPKPLLPIGDKPILQYAVERLTNFGIQHLTISVNYLGEQIREYFGGGEDFGMEINYVTEDSPRGTLGAVSEISRFHHDYVLVMNSDLLTTIDLEEMFAEMLAKEADMVVGTVPYEVKVPYGVIETDGDLITALREKPTYTYYSNAGIYLVKREHLALVPTEGPYDAPDLVDELSKRKLRVTHFPILDYWLDIGKPDDYQRAQRDISHLKL